jgi:hypothetical protein
MIKNFFTLSGATLFIGIIQASEPPISVAELAKISGYPAEKIIVVDTTERSNEQATRKKKPLCLSHHYYSSGDASFADVSVAIGKKGTALSPELEAKFNKTLETPNYPGNLRALTLGPGIKGFSGIGMAGGGGSMNRSVVSLSNYDRDIQVTISFGEDRLTPLEGAETYQNTIITSEGVNAIIEECLTVASNNVITSLSSGGISAAPSESTEKQQQSLPPPQTLPSKTPVLLPQPEPPAAASNKQNWWIAGIALAVLAFIANALRKPRC